LDVIQRFSAYYLELNKFAVKETKIIEEKVNYVAIFELLNHILLKLQSFIQRDMGVAYNEIPNWLL
jgi:hypothetical protein